MMMYGYTVCRAYSSFLVLFFQFVVRLLVKCVEKLCNYSLATVDEVEMHIKI